MYESILFELDRSIGVLRLNRPEKLNAFSGAMRSEIADVLEIVAADNRIRVLIVTGEGRGFCAGGDIVYLKKLRDTGDEIGFRSLLEQGRSITRRLRTLSKPVIAVVNGPCAGAGFSFALGCDIRIASEKATFGPSFALIGLHPDWGGSWFLPKLVGPARACELIFRGSMVSAAEAERIGLVNRMVPPDDLMRQSFELAGQIAATSPQVLRLAKESIYRSLTSDLEAAYSRETEVQLECFRSEDFLEGLTAFLEKRKPEFRGR